MHGYKAIKRGFIRHKSQGAKLEKKGYHHVGTTSAFSSEQAIQKTTANDYETTPEPLQRNETTISTQHKEESVGALENIWASDVFIKLIRHHKLNVEALPQHYQIILKTLILSLKDKGMSKEEVLNVFNQLAEKHGGLLQVLEFYSKAL